MDFKTPPEVIDALIKSAQHGIFGYSESKQDYFSALHNWFKTRFDWEIRPEWLIKTPGVVYAIATAIRALTSKGDSVLIQQPVYYPFSQLISENERKLVNNPLKYQDGSYHIDFYDFEKKIVDNEVKVFILCNPHNPVGKVWKMDELIRLGDICVKHNVIVISDEIHADFIYNPHKHFVFSGLKPEFEPISIVCTAPSKTFNLAGLQVSNIFIANDIIKRKFKKEMSCGGYSQLNSMGLIACCAAYRYGAKWVDELIEYLKENLEYIRNFLNERLPQVELVEPEGTYLVWLDFKKLHLTDEELDHLIVDQANLWLDGGTMFGNEGSGFQRVNIACPRSILEKAMFQLEKAIKLVENNNVL